MNSEDENDNLSGSDSDITECYDQVSAEDVDEDESDDEMETSESSESGVFIGKDGTSWLDITNQPRRGRVQNQNILRATPGVTTHALGQVRPNQFQRAFKIFISQDIVTHIINCTINEAWLQTNKTDFSLSVVDFSKFLALVIARGVLGCQTYPLDSL